MRHYKEKWTLSDDNSTICQENGYAIYEGGFEDDSDTARAVDCVNAMAGVQNPNVLRSRINDMKALQKAGREHLKEHGFILLEDDLAAIYQMLDDIEIEDNVDES